MLARANEPDILVCRLRRILLSAQLSCQCRTSLDEALARFLVLETRRLLRRSLREARSQRDWIASQLLLLVELNEITEHETDQTVFEEMVLLFDGIESAAAAASRALREVSDPRLSNAHSGSAC